MSERRTTYRVTLWVSIVLGLGILMVVNYLGSRHYRRFDWTKSGLYTLSEKTEKVLKDLKTPVTVTVFMTEGSPLYSEAEELLRRYRAKSSMVVVETLDPTRNLARAEALVKEFNVKDRTVVFRSGDKKKYVTEDQMVEYDFSRARFGMEPTIKAFKGEQEFTSALLAVTQQKTPKVLYTAGHGERDFDSRVPAGFFVLTESLRRDNCTVEKWESLGAADVPAGTDALLVAGPRTPFTEGEIAAVKKYLDGGGQALFLLDAEFAPGGGRLVDLGLKPLLSGYGLRVDDDIVIDPKRSVPGRAETIFATSFRPHPVTRPLSEPTPSAVIFFLARSIGLAEKLPEGVTGTVLVETSSDGWGETDLKDLAKMEKQDADVKAPVPLASAVEVKGADGKKRTRIVAIGDADFASNAGIVNAGNVTFATAAVNWVLERESLVAIPPKSTDQVAVTLSATDISRMSLFAVVLLPLLAIALGIAVWVKRRR